MAKNLFIKQVIELMITYEFQAGIRLPLLGLFFMSTW